MKPFRWARFESLKGRTIKEATFAAGDAWLVLEPERD